MRDFSWGQPICQQIDLSPASWDQTWTQKKKKVKNHLVASYRGALQKACGAPAPRKRRAEQRGLSWWISEVSCAVTHEWGVFWGAAATGSWWVEGRCQPRGQEDGIGPMGCYSHSSRPVVPLQVVSSQHQRHRGREAAPDQGRPWQLSGSAQQEQPRGFHPLCQVSSW